LRARFAQAVDADPILTDGQFSVGGNMQQTGQPIGEMDTQIAAHALALGLPLVTHNTRHFKRVAGLKLEDWMA
jgi:predicted nucleic acid-binding protein